MKNKIFNISVLILSGLSLFAPPAHAGMPLLDSLKHAISSLSTIVKNEVNNYYCENSQDDSADSVDTAPMPAPAPPPPESPLAKCKQFLAIQYDTDYISDPKKVATIYLNGVLDFQAKDFDAKLSEDEIAQRNACALLALEQGANPNSNGSSSDPSSDPMFQAPTPIVRAVTNRDEVAVKILLEHKANPNAVDSGLGKAIPVLSTAVYNSQQEIALDLINAGADVSTKDLLWSAAGNASDKVVAALIQSKKIPVNQVDKFSDFPDDQGETALDASERAIFALKAYQQKFAADSNATAKDKLEEVNHILYYTYPLKPQLKSGAEAALVDPDAYVRDLLSHQQNVSDSLKAAGWTCIEEACGKPSQDNSLDTTIN